MPLVPFHLNELSLILTWTSNYIHYEEWGKITNPGAPLKFGNG